MDVLSPNLMWINGSCYRINSVQETIDDIPTERTAPYIENDPYEEDECEDDYDITTASNGRFKTSLHVPNAFRGIVIGAKGVTKKRIEAETKTTIDIPKPGNSGHVEIFGTIRQNVAAARRRIEVIVLGGRAKQQVTHIVCIPAIDATIKDRFNKFKQEILSGPPAYGIDENVFQKPEKIHLTLCGLSLMDNEDRCAAAEILQDCKNSIIKPTICKDGPIDFRIAGVEYMNDDPGQVNVLYAKVHSERLQQLADALHEYFISRGLVQRQYDRVKLHATLMNTRYSDSDYFDARRIIEKYANYEFGHVQLRDIHLSQRFTSATDGFFEATAILKVE